VVDIKVTLLSFFLYLPGYSLSVMQDVVVGDIALLEPGEIVPCDGIFLSGHNVKCDESGATGESDAIKKDSFEECELLAEEGLPFIHFCGT
jgi:P-type E1-E2 ATPase